MANSHLHVLVDGVEIRCFGGNSPKVREKFFKYLKMDTQTLNKKHPITINAKTMTINIELNSNEWLYNNMSYMSNMPIQGI